MIGVSLRAFSHLELVNWLADKTVGQELMPEAGAYMNEGDPAEPNWRWRFYGYHYRRLLGIKRRWDPWGIFWARTTVGSEAWEVLTLDGYPASQNGRLCRVQQDE